MQEAKHNDMISEFSAMRASQAPRPQLRGIKTQNIQTRDEKSEKALTDPSILTQTSDEVPSPSAASTTRDTQQNGEVPVLPSQPIPHFSFPRPRSTHEPAVSDSFPALESDQPSKEVPEQALGFQSSPYEEECADYPIGTWTNGVYDIGIPHAVTTPDNAAQPLRAPIQMIRTELSRVLEEDEIVEIRRNSAVALTANAAAPRPLLRSSKSSPNIRQSAQRLRPESTTNSLSDRSSHTIRPSSVFVQPHNDIPFRPRSLEHFGASPDHGSNTWEDDIDWCYKHEAEADSNFDWHRTSAARTSVNTIDVWRKTQIVTEPIQEDDEDDHDVYLHQPAKKLQRTSSIYSFAPSLVIRSETDLPDLEPPSAVSTQSSFDGLSEAATPPLTSSLDLHDHVLTATCKPACQDWVEHSSTLPPNERDSTMIYEDSYHVIYARKSLPEQPFDIGHIDLSTISARTSRSSSILMNNTGSQENSWSRREHRSNSGGSVPDLVHSKASSRRASRALDQPTDRSSQCEAPPATTVDNSQVSKHRRRSPNLAKDVAHKSMSSKITYRSHLEDEEDEMPMPPRFNDQDRPHSDAGIRGFDAWDITPPARPHYNRSRSGSATAAMKSPSFMNRSNPFPTHSTRDDIRA